MSKSPRTWRLRVPCSPSCSKGSWVVPVHGLVQADALSAGLSLADCKEASQQCVDQIADRLFHGCSVMQLRLTSHNFLMPGLRYSHCVGRVLTNTYIWNPPMRLQGPERRLVPGPGPETPTPPSSQHQCPRLLKISTTLKETQLPTKGSL